jgi:hypothetical protein
VINASSGAAGPRADHILRAAESQGCHCTQTLFSEFGPEKSSFGKIFSCQLEIASLKPAILPPVLASRL